MNLMKWYGITGGIASGKSTVSQKLRNLGFKVVDADQLARDVVVKGSPGLQSVVDRFGGDVLSSSGELDRKKLGSKVFGQPTELLALENILHPLIRKETDARRAALAQAGEAFAFYDVPLLFEKQMEPLFDGIVVVAADESVQIQRMKTRDGLNDTEIAKRLAAQIPLKEKSAKAHFVIQNNGDLKLLDAQIAELVQRAKSGKI